MISKTTRKLLKLQKAARWQSITDAMTDQRELGTPSRNVGIDYCRLSAFQRLTIFTCNVRILFQLGKTDLFSQAVQMLALPQLGFKTTGTLPPTQQKNFGQLTGIEYWCMDQPYNRGMAVSVFSCPSPCTNFCSGQNLSLRESSLQHFIKIPGAHYENHYARTEGLTPLNGLLILDCTKRQLKHGGFLGYKATGYFNSLISLKIMVLVNLQGEKK